MNGFPKIVNLERAKADQFYGHKICGFKKDIVLHMNLLVLSIGIIFAFNRHASVHDRVSNILT